MGGTDLWSKNAESHPTLASLGCGKGEWAAQDSVPGLLGTMASFLAPSTASSCWCLARGTGHQSGFRLVLKEHRSAYNMGESPAHWSTGPGCDWNSFFHHSQPTLRRGHWPMGPGAEGQRVPLGRARSPQCMLWQCVLACNNLPHLPISCLQAHSSHGPGSPICPAPPPRSH